MSLLAREYRVGIIAVSVICVALYLIFSIRLIVTSRREGIDICMLAMIPVLNVFMWIRKCIVHIKNSRKFKEDDEIEF